ncbi:lytic transglycosylase domain-containing protein [Arcticibacter sp. MXS-1]|uniref:lytic transglycosylase domain-containing protein n=1 Tax=Arcticibacter sp. MXS-1 TaxID=3341726 RepID=UPI0035A97DA2
MIKKHLIACSVILLLIISSKIWMKRDPQTPIISFPQPVDFPSPQEQKVTSPKAKFSFANEKVPLHNKKVAWKMDKYLKKNSYKHIQTDRLHSKAKEWFPVIEPILARHGIPEDFKYIPLVESGLMWGTSHRGAAGYWQFMPHTARTYGLKITRSVDERNDLRKSTLAACRYLKELHAIFKNWTLVAAAYNIGENSLKQHISRQGHRNYFKMRLNRETASYIYKLVSMKEIIEHPVKYGYSARNRRLLARKEESVKAPFHEFMSAEQEQKAVKAFSILQSNSM